ncbi:MAG: DEAD/DEAH box helicase [Desulfocucumaceae bacterium]
MTQKQKRRPRRKKTPGADTPGPLSLDPFQEEAVKVLAEGHNLLVAAPTGTGKTLIAEILIEREMASGLGVVYTSPIKALSNQKYRDFAGRFGKEKVGLITGDVSVNERAPLLVMTTEIFRNWCFANPEMLEGITHVIFDELHYLDDIERGTAWEESIIFAPSHIRVVGLSATVPNANQLADWIADVRGQQVVVIEEKRRAVPLELNWISPEGDVYGEAEAKEHIKQLIERRKGRWISSHNDSAELTAD